MKRIASRANAFHSITFEKSWRRAGIVGRKSIALLLSTVLATQPLLGHASELVADPSAPDAQLPVITSGNNGVPVVDIARPNDGGLSHNKYDTFNVGTQGVILNNSVEGFSQSQLGGLLSSNPHLQGSAPASVILTEVTGANRSLLEGMLEVHGTPANVIIANPHGLTCNGCGFLNTPRVTLSTGTPEFGDDLSLKGLTVKGGDVTIGEKGANLSSVSIFDIVSRKISIQGPISGKDDINLVAGANRYDYASGNAEALPGDGQEPEIAIDSSALGGMYAGRIRVISNDKGSGVNMQGQMASNAGELSISADGKLILRSAKAVKEISAKSRSASVRLEEKVFSEDAVVLEGHASVDLAEGALLFAGSDATLAGKAVSIGNGAVVAAGANNKGELTDAGTLSIKAETAAAGGASLAAGKLLSIAANEVYIADPAPRDSPVLRSLGNVDIRSSTINAINSFTAAGGDISISTEHGLNLNHGRYRAKGKLSIEAASVTTSASLYGARAVSALTRSQGLVNLGEIASSSDVLLTSAAELINSGRMISNTRVGLSASTHLTNNKDAVVFGRQGVAAAAATIINDGKLGSADGSIDLKSRGEVINAGILQARTHATVETEGGTTNHGTIKATDLLIRTVGGLTNYGRLEGNNKVEIGGKEGGFAPHVLTEPNAVVRAGSWSYIAARYARTAGSIGSVNGGLEIRVAGDLYNTGLLYSQQGARYLIKGSIANVGGDILSPSALTIKGLNAPMAASLLNESGNIEAGSGDLHISAREIINRRPALPTVTENKSSNTQEDSSKTITTAITRQNGVLSGTPAKIVAGRNMHINADKLSNSYSQIASRGGLTIQGGSVTNEGRDLLQTIDTTTVIHHHERHCRTRVLGVCFKKHSYHWDETLHDKKVDVIGSLYGTIQAGSFLNVNATGYVHNNAVRGDLPGLGVSAQGRNLAAVTASDSVHLPQIADVNALDVSVDGVLGRQAIFQPVAAPDAPFVIETRSEFIDPKKFHASDYFLDRITEDQKPALKRLGDGYVEYQVLRDQRFDLTGKMAPGSPEDHNAKLKAEYQAAIDALISMGLNVGEPLSKEQAAKLPSDIVWLEKKEVLGRPVLVPRLYAATNSIQSTDRTGSQIKGGDVNVGAAEFKNTGAVTSEDRLAISSQTDLVNEGGTLAAAGDVALNAEGTVANLSGKISGGNVAITGTDVVNETLKTRDEHANGFVDRVHDKAEINARGDLAISADKEVVAKGGTLAAGEDLSIEAGGSVELSALGAASVRDDKNSAGYSKGTEVSHLVTDAKAGDDVTITAGEDAKLQGAKVAAGDDATITAGGSVELSAVQNSESRDVKLDLKKRGLFGVETNIREQQAGTETEATTISAGGDATIIAEAGDVTLEASQITSGGDTTLAAKEGQVVLKTTEDQSIQQSYKYEKDLFWWNQRDQGSTETKIRNVEIEAGGGLKIVADEGVTLEYNKTGSLDASLEQLAEAPGLSWIKDIRNDPALEGKVDWRAVEEEFQSWDYKAQGLTQAGAALVALFAAAVTGPFTGIASNLSSATSGALGVAGNATMEAAIGAGVNSLISKSAVAFVNNKGDIGDALKELGSSENLRSLAISMVTAGLVTKIAVNLKIPEVSSEATVAQNMSAAARRGVIETAVRVSAETTIGGRNIEDAMKMSLKVAAADAIGSVVATEIGTAARAGEIDKAAQLIAHAGLGCVVGGIVQSDCAGGAAGAVTAEVIADWTKDKIVVLRALDSNSMPEQIARETQKLQKEIDDFRQKGIDVAALTGGLASAIVSGKVDSGASAGRNAVEHNFLCGGLCIAAGVFVVGSVYVAIVGKGDVAEGLALFGEGEDPLSKAVASGAEKAVEISAANFPEATMAVLSGLEAASETVDVVISYTDDVTGNVVSTQWNSLDPKLRNQLKGSGKLLSIAIPAAKVKAVAELAGAAKVAKASPLVGGRAIAFDGDFYSADGFKFSKSYYERLWKEGRPAPFLQARNILDSQPTITPDPRGAPGYFRYEGAGMEMIYNPTTGQVGHVQPIR